LTTAITIEATKQTISTAIATFHWTGISGGLAVIVAPRGKA
jgi:hypothetical protein